MRALLLLLLVWGALLGLSEPAVAQVVLKTGEICVEVETTVTDLAGDEWTESGPTPRPAHGVKYEIVDAAGTQEGWLNSDGCKNIQVQTELNMGTITLRVNTRARVNGVDMVSWEGSDYTSTRTYQWVQWTFGTGTTTTFSRTRTVTNNDQRWLNLMVGTMVFRDYDWNVEEPNDRDCCLDDSTGYNLDGTCPNPASGGYALITTPIQMQANPFDGCCGSSLAIHGDDEHQGPPGLYTGTNVARKFPIAHELGHVIAGMRMGGKEWGQYANNVPTDGCAGDYEKSGGIWTLLPDDQRGIFSKDPMSAVLREGWADFVSAVTWNARFEGDCVYQAQKGRHDFDLDGVIDDERSGDSMDGAYDCDGIPSLAGDPTLASYMYVISENWLDNLEASDDDNVDSVQCVRDSNNTAESYHRSTVYDALRFFWHLTTDQGVHPDVMSDVYVDMCPRGWFHGYYPTSVTSDLPFNRLMNSANHHGVWTEYDDESDHLLH